MKCLACESTALVEGSLVDTANGGAVSFQPSEVSTLKKMFGVGSRSVLAYACIHCRNLQFTVEFNEEDRRKYQQFEGQQPGVLERVNSEVREREV